MTGRFYGYLPSGTLAVSRVAPLPSGLVSAITRCDSPSKTCTVVEPPITAIAVLVLDRFGTASVGVAHYQAISVGTLTDVPTLLNLLSLQLLHCTFDQSFFLVQSRLKWPTVTISTSKNGSD